MARAWHHLPVSAIAVLWHLLAAGDFLALRLEVDVYTAGFSEVQMNWFLLMPLWIEIAWGIGVWAGFLGAILLLARSGTAGSLFALSFLGWAVTAVGMIVLREPSVMEVTGYVGLGFLIAAVVLAFLFFLYARSMRARLRR
ncbi:hypothetical protein [Pseudoruegeria sp. HB172150]|uniref:hypothetical protein n=1 Tax=Pseudoruegeria sp. HB172150 TaxID=2721164 RepID=UPI0015543DF8|nr:hypothetical protein [Pseudoruegeria sp. HB172150]